MTQYPYEQPYEENKYKENNASIAKPRVIPAKNHTQRRPRSAQNNTPNVNEHNPGRQPVRYSQEQSPFANRSANNANNANNANQKRYDQDDYRQDDYRQAYNQEPYDQQANNQNTYNQEAYEQQSNNQGRQYSDQQNYYSEQQNNSYSDQGNWRQDTQGMAPAQRDYKKNKPQRHNMPPKKKKHTALYIGISFICILLLVTIGVFLTPQLTGSFFYDLPNIAFVNGKLVLWDGDYMNTYKTHKSYLSRDTFYPGVWVDGIHLGDMTMEEAKTALQDVTTQSISNFSVTIKSGGRSWTLDNSRVPISRNIDDVLKTAFVQGRQYTWNTLALAATPFDARFDQAMNLRTNGAFYQTEITYDQETVRELINTIASDLYKSPVNAEIINFDFTNRAFTFSNEQMGQQLNAEELYSRVIAKLDAREYGATIQMDPEPLAPEITKDYLSQNFRQISSFSTKTTSNKNRNTNIDLSANALNGSTVLPGETYSFNQATGQRTSAKGYQEAVAIAGGANRLEVGGGVCQTSSTLFNAVVRADLEIIERSPHAWPSSYVDKGMDATVNWPNLDFKFKNNKDFPVFIVAYYSDRVVTVEIYGMSLGEGIAIELYSETIETIKPPTGVKYVQNTSLPSGTSKETIQARTGYVVKTYKVWYKNGAEIDRKELFTSNYKMYQRTVEYN